MNRPIQLSLTGDGRFIILNPATVRKAYFQFNSVNPEYNCQQKYRLQVPLYQREDLTILDALHRHNQIKLHTKDILKVEQELNQQLLRHNLALVKDEAKLMTGYGLCQKVAKDRQKVQYITRYGLIFILEPITKSKVITMKNPDLFWQDRNFDFHYVRYCGLLSSSRHQRIELLFRDRLNLAKSWTLSTAEFQPRQIFTISAIYPCSGFCLLN
jgi:hypothetical protein